MSNNKDIEPRNSKGKAHGYWEWYYHNGNLMYKSFFNNGRRMGYDEIYLYIGKLYRKVYHI